MLDKIRAVFKRLRGGVAKGSAAPYLYTTLLVIVVLFVTLISLRVYPFGDRAYLWADADQYLGIEQYFATLASGDNDLFYSWGNVLGGNALSQLAYYSFSPFNLLFFIFSGQLIFVAHAVVYLKILCCALAFCFCLNYFHRQKYPFVQALFSTTYAFMGYLVFYGWNASWMDGVILLPLVFVGIYRIVTTKRSLLYIITLALALISNFYIGFMLCLSSLIFYLVLILRLCPKFWPSLRKTIFTYLLASMISVGLCAFILIPTYLALPADRKLSILGMVWHSSLNVTPAEILSGLFTGQNNALDTNSPLIYVSILPVVLNILFFVRHQTPLKTKLLAAGLLVLFAFSFMNSFINQIWHGFSDNAWFNYRYSFVCSFIILLIAYESYLQLRQRACTQRDCLLTTAILLLLTTFVLQNANHKIFLAALSFDLVFAAFMIGLLAQKQQHSKLFTAICVGGLIPSLLANNYLCLRLQNFQSVSAYDANSAIMSDAKQVIADDSFYRMDKNWTHGRCDGNLFNYRGITNYASTENVDNLDFLRRLGVNHQYFYAKYTSDLPAATEALLGLKYILTTQPNSKDYAQIGNSGELIYYQNPNALPVLFPVATLDNSDFSELNDFELLNSIWRSINRLDAKVFNRNILSSNTAGNQSTLTISVAHAGSLYLYLPEQAYTNITLSSSHQNKTLNYDERSEIYYLGEFVVGDTVELSFVSAESLNLNSVVAYTEDADVIRQNVELVQRQDLSIRQIHSSQLEMNYLGANKLIATTIPYDQGWRVYDNGKLIATEENWGNFLAFRLDESEQHQITLIYRPVGYHVGLIISFGSLAGLIIFIYLSCRQKSSSK